ncbi:MAG: hypothetical protein N0E56_15745 [Candidatus Thiodiazotropha endolucinida]|nr:hypothetical protein [Candidatus Thiodiazotropha taylori]MCW4268076.1 hypothetical protein [Candidatus Thiodiazotropha endolucinida]
MQEFNDDLTTELGENNVSIGFDDETILWEGRPSQILNLWNYFCCICAVLFSLYSLWYWHSELYVGYENLTPFINIACQSIIAGSLMLMVYFYFDIWYEKTTITRNKIKEEKGITRLFKQERYCEISDIRDIKSPPPGVILGMFNLANLEIETNDDDQPVVEIRAIPDRDELIATLLPIWRKLKLERKGFFADH